jgi:hypothetical protein
MLASGGGGGGYYSTPYYSVYPNEVTYDSSSSYPSYYQTYQGPEVDNPDYTPKDGAKTPMPKPMVKDPASVPQIIPEKGVFPSATPLDSDLDP